MNPPADAVTPGTQPECGTRTVIEELLTTPDTLIAQHPAPDPLAPLARLIRKLADDVDELDAEVNRALERTRQRLRPTGQPDGGFYRDAHGLRETAQQVEAACAQRDLTARHLRWATRTYLQTHAHLTTPAS